MQKTAHPLFRVYLFGTFAMERLCSETLAYEAVPGSFWSESRPPRQLFKTLVMSPHRRSQRITLLDRLCPQEDPAHAEEYMQQAASKLRRSLGDLFLSRRKDGKKEIFAFQLADQSVIWTDVDACFEVLRQAEQVGADRLALYREACQYFTRGLFLEDEDEAWMHAIREDLRREYYRCLLFLADDALARGAYMEVRDLLTPLLQDEFVSQDAVYRMMLALEAQGAPYEALQLYQDMILPLKEQGEPIVSSLRIVYRRLVATKREGEISASLEQPQEIGRVPAVSPRISPLFPSPPPLFGESASPEKGAEDPNSDEGGLQFARSTGNRVALLLMAALQWRGSCETLQAYANREIVRDMSLDGKTERSLSAKYTRRQALITMAAAAGALGCQFYASHGYASSRSTVVKPEDYLGTCAMSILACWHLTNDGEFGEVNTQIAVMLPELGALLRDTTIQRSPLLFTVSELISQAYLLKGVVALHKMDLDGREACCERAVRFAQGIPNKTLYCASLIQYAYSLYAKREHAKALLFFEKASEVCKVVPSRLCRAKCFVELSTSYASVNRLAEANRALNEAKEIFYTPIDLASEPIYLVNDFGEASMSLFEIITALESGHHHADHYGDADRVFTKIDTLQSAPKRFLNEIINRRAETALHRGRFDEFSHYFALGVQGATELRSRKRRQELVEIYQTARTFNSFKHESRFSELGDLLIASTF